MKTEAALSPVCKLVSNYKATAVGTSHLTHNIRRLLEFAIYGQINFCRWLLVIRAYFWAGS
jgi:hypothetical protein